MHLWDVSWSSYTRASALVFCDAGASAYSASPCSPALVADDALVKRFQHLLERLKAAGFQLFHSHKNPQSALINLGPVYNLVPCCYELSFVRIQDEVVGAGGHHSPSEAVATPQIHVAIQGKLGR